MSREKQIVKVGRHSIAFDTEGDLYGIDWWNRVGSGRWEPSTIGWVETSVKEGSFFLDLGAASGLLSIIAAKNGAKVLAVEPLPSWVQVLRRNLALNDVSVDVFEGGVAVASGEVDFSLAADRSVMTDISRLSSAEPFVGKIRTATIPDLLAHIGDSSSEVRIKIDIEGVELAILKDPLVLSSLSAVSAEVLVSFHPGFLYARDDISEMLGSVLQRWNRTRGVLDAFGLFRRLEGLATVSLVNGEAVNSASQFAALNRFGFHDFILRFDA